MIQETSFQAYEEILRKLPDNTRPVYRTIIENPGIAIGEIGQLLKMQNSTVSGRVGDLIEDGLIHYEAKDGVPDKKISSVSGKPVMKLKANNVFEVPYSLLKGRAARRQNVISPDSFKVQHCLKF